MILITGATGNIGAELVRNLPRNRQAVRGFVRNRTQAQTIHLPRIELVEGDFAEPKTLTPALGNVNRLFLLVPSSLEVEQQKGNFVDAAKRSKVKLISKPSRLGADDKAPGRFQRSYQGVFYAPAGNAKVSVVDVRDIASVAARVLSGSGHEGKTYDIIGPQTLTHAEMANQLSKAAGKPIKVVDVPPAR